MCGAILVFCRCNLDLHLRLDLSLMKKATVVLIFGLAGARAMACSVCLGDPSSHLTKSANAAALFLLVIAGAILSGLGALFISWSRRGRDDIGID